MSPPLSPRRPRLPDHLTPGAPEEGEEGRTRLGPQRPGLISPVVHLGLSPPLSLARSLPAPRPSPHPSVHGSWPRDHCPLPALGTRTKENGSDRDPLHPDHLSKRPCTLSPAQRCSPSNGLPQPTPPPHYRLEDMAVAHHFRDSYRHLDPRELRERHRQLGERRAAGVHACAKWRWGRAEHPGLPCARERWRCPGRMGTEDVGAEERFAPHPAWAAPRSLRDSHLSRGGATGCRHLRARRAPPHGRWAPWLQRCLSWGLRRARYGI